MLPTSHLNKKPEKFSPFVQNRAKKIERKFESEFDFFCLTLYIDNIDVIDFRCASAGETSIMIRRPVLKILSSLQKVDWTLIENAPRFVLWGTFGRGKSLSLAHVRHALGHASQDNGIVTIDFGRLRRWLTQYKLIGKSKYFVEQKGGDEEGRFDHLHDSQRVLQTFEAENTKKIEHLKTSKVKHVITLY